MYTHKHTHIHVYTLTNVHTHMHGSNLLHCFSFTVKTMFYCISNHIMFSPGRVTF